MRTPPHFVEFGSNRRFASTRECGYDKVTSLLYGGKDSPYRGAIYLSTDELDKVLTLLIRHFALCTLRIMTKIIKKMVKSLTIEVPGVVEPEGYCGGKIVGDKEEICLNLLMGDRTSYEYYTGVWDIRYPDGEPVWEWIPEAKGMREAGVLDGMLDGVI